MARFDYSKISGVKFNELTVISFSHKDKHNFPHYLCECSCGTKRTFSIYAVKNGMIKSCGCIKIPNIIAGAKLHNTKHGATKKDNLERLYRIWVGVKNRCNNKLGNRYKDYGGRGIMICSEWISDYPKFKEYCISIGYADNLTIDRIDNNGNYEPNNIRFVTRGENSRNKRSSKLSMDKAKEIRFLKQVDGWSTNSLSEKFGVGQGVIRKVINNEAWV